ncbi:MAG: dihydroorotase [Paracoccaceae bacterium]
MSTVFLQNAHLIDPQNGTVDQGNILIKEGVIAARGAIVSAPGKETRIIDCAGKYLAPGIIDIGVKVCEPGERHKESFKSAGLAAAAGGITTIVTRPDTVPAIDTPETLEFIRRRAMEASIVNVLPMAALTKRREGREMTEIGFLQDAGAVGFTDCDRVVRDVKVLTRALSYARSLGAWVMGHPQDPYLSEGAAVTSGKFATLRGLPGVSPLAERMGVDRDISLIEMTGASYHFDQITTARAVPALARAKSNGLNITAGTSIHHLTLNEFDVAEYRTFFKLKPPLRSEDDRLAIIDALKDGTIDIISSMHTPQDEESKRLPFEEAASGAVGLETLLPAALRLYHGGLLDLPSLFRAMSLNPAKRLGLPAGRLEVGAPADLVLFDPDAPFVLNRFGLLSKSKNTPFDEARMQGKVLRTFVNGNEVYQR